MIMKPNQFKQDPYDFPDSTNRTWKDAAEFIQKNRKAKKRPTTSMHDRLTQLEQKLKEAKQ